MSDVQKLKDLLAKYHEVTKKKGYDDGGVVSSDDLAPYMPSKEEEASSGLPPGPQRASYIANKKYQAAHPAPQGYDDGGQVSPSPSPSTSPGPKLDPEKVKKFQQGFNSGDVGVGEALANAKKALGFSNGGVIGYDDGGQVSSMTPQNSSPLGGELQQILAQAASNATDANNPPAPANQIPLPNGGMDGQALADYIKANPGPVATTGNNPANTKDSEDEEDDKDIKGPKLASAAKAKDDSDEDEDEDDEEEDAATSKVKPSNPSDPNATPQNRQLTLQDLQNAQKRDNLIGGITGLLGGSRARDIYDKHSGVAQLQQQLQSQGEITKNTLAQYQLADEKEKNDVNSGASTLARNVLLSSAKQAGIQLGDISKMSASSIEKQFPSVAHLIDTQANAQQRAEAAKDRNAMLQLNLGNKKEQVNQKQLIQAQQNLQKDKNYSTAVAGSQAADEAQDQLDLARKNGGAVAAQAVPVVMARLMTHGQRINQTEIHALTGSPDISSYSQRMMNKAATGTLTDKDYNDMSNLAKVVKQSSERDKSNMENSAAQRLSQVNNGEMADNFQKLTGRQYQAPTQRTPQNDTSSQQITPDVAKYASDHNLTPQQALAIKQKRMASQ